MLWVCFNILLNGFIIMKDIFRKVVIIFDNDVDLHRMIRYLMTFGIGWNEDINPSVNSYQTCGELYGLFIDEYFYMTYVNYRDFGFDEKNPGVQKNIHQFIEYYNKEYRYFYYKDFINEYDLVSKFIAIEMGLL